MTYHMGVLLIIRKRNFLYSLLAAWAVGILSAFVVAALFPDQRQTAGVSAINHASWCARPPATSLPQHRRSLSTTFGAEI